MPQALQSARAVSVDLGRSGGLPRADLTWSVNAVAESFFSSLKKERIKKRIYKNREIAIADISDYIEAFYKSNATPQPSRRSKSRRI